MELCSDLKLKLILYVSRGSVKATGSDGTPGWLVLSQSADTRQNLPVILSKGVLANNTRKEPDGRALLVRSMGPVHLIAMEKDVLPVRSPNSAFLQQLGLHVFALL